MKEYNWSTIEKYFEGDLTTSELDAFKTLMENGKDFKEIVNLYQEIEDSLTSRASNQKEENDLRNTLEDLGKTYANKGTEDMNTSKVFNLKKYSKYLVAASLILFASIFYLNNRSSVSYSDFSNHSSLDLVVRGTSNEHLVKAQKAFNSKNYKLASEELQFMVESEPSKTDLQLYLAISFLEQDKFDKAEIILENIHNGNSIYKNKAIWYLALSKLKQKDFTACKEILLTLPKDSEDYSNAQKILNKL